MRTTSRSSSQSRARSTIQWRRERAKGQISLCCGGPCSRPAGKVCIAGLRGRPAADIFCVAGLCYGLLVRVARAGQKQDLQLRTLVQRVLALAFIFANHECAEVFKGCPYTHRTYGSAGALGAGPRAGRGARSELVYNTIR